MQNDNGKKAAGVAAAELVQDGMLVGLGTGSTAAFFIRHLIERCRQGLKIEAVATSTASYELAKKGGIPLIDINQITSIDFAADGADEIDSQKRMIKGGGGALLREKVVASMSKEWVVIVDSKKWVTRLGKAPLPVEILPFAYRATEAKIEKLGLEGEFRRAQERFFVTENGNYIFDIHFKDFIKHPEELNQQLIQIPGVLETGFFFNLAHQVIIGYPDGHAEFHTQNILKKV